MTFAATRWPNLQQIGAAAEPAVAGAQSLASSLAPAVVLPVESLAAFLFALWAISRTDVTGYAMTEAS